MLVAAAAKFDYYKCMETYLFFFFQAGDMTLGPDILNPLILNQGGCDFVEGLLNSDFAFDITDEVIDNILKSSHGFLLSVFNDYWYDVKVSPERIDMAIEHEGVEGLQFLLELDGSHDMVSDKLLSQAAAKENMELLDVLHSVFLPSMDILNSCLNPDD